MEGMNRGMESEMNFIQSPENKRENQLEKMLEPYVFSKKTEPDMTSLAEEEGRRNLYNVRAIKDEGPLCDLKKGFQQKLLQCEKMEDVFKMLKGIKGKFCSDFSSALQQEMKAKLPRTKYQEAIRPKEDKETGKEIPAYLLKAKERFSDMEKGMLREITAVRAFNAISGEVSGLKLKAQLASPEMDTNNKVDVIAYDLDNDKIVFSIQVKGDNSGECEVVEEIKDNPTDRKKKEFYRGSQRFEKSLNASDPDIKVIKIWLSISDNDIKTEGIGIDEDLRVDIEYGIRRILNIYRK